MATRYAVKVDDTQMQVLDTQADAAQFADIWRTVLANALEDKTVTIEPIEDSET